MTNLRTLLVRSLACCCGLVLLSALASRASAQEVEWRHDYAKAREEAKVKGRPVMIDFYTKDCFHCKRMDAGPFRDAVVVQFLNSRFIPLKVDGEHNPGLVEFLKIQFYPTLVFASTDGRVLGSQEGYIETQALRETLERVLAATGDTDGMLRRFAEGVKAREAGDFPQALALFKQLADESKGRPIQARALQQMQEVDQLARAQAQRPPDLTVATGPRPPEPSSAQSVVASKVIEPIRPEGPQMPPFPQKPEPIRPGNAIRTPETNPVALVPPPPPSPTPLQPNELISPEPSQPLAALTEFSRLLKGTFAARPGAQMLYTLVTQTDSPEAIRVRQANDLLHQAKEDYQKQRYLACLDRCQLLMSSYGDLATESMAAMQMESEIRKNPEWIKLACDQLGDRLSLMYLNLAETWLAKGEPQQAIFYLERVLQTAPNTRYAETAQVRLTQLQGVPPNRSSDPRR